jgi:sugar/nucleoside kinase (ribokinase family)
MRSASGGVLVVGDLNPDLLVSGDDPMPRFGQQEQYADMYMTLGGSAGIFAAGCARLGVPTALVATVGDDDLGRVALEALRARDVDVRPVRSLPHRRTGLSIHFLRDDDRAILTEPGAMQDVSVGDALAYLSPGPAHVHLAAVYLLPALLRDGGELIDHAHAAGATVSVDTNFDPSGRFDRPDWLTRADILLPNEQEALGLARRVDGDVEAAARALAMDGALVVVKRGAAGALAIRGNERHDVSAPSVTPVDAVGAGDSFDAGLVAALLAGRSVDDALLLACACGALSTRAPGGVDGQATLAEADAVHTLGIP